MLKTIRFILILSIALFYNKGVCQTNNFSSRKPIVVIDPGHGGRDSGAVSRNGIMEKDIVLSIALKMDSINRYFYNNKLDLYLTRYKDTLISLRDRTRLAKELEAAVFISLHCNHCENPNAKGVEVYISRHRSKISDESILLAYLLEKSLFLNIGMKGRGVKFANFQVLRDNNSRVSVLVELGFLSNGDEADYLIKTSSQNDLALLILKKILSATQ